MNFYSKILTRSGAPPAIGLVRKIPDSKPPRRIAFILIRDYCKPAYTQPYTLMVLIQGGGLVRLGP